MSKVYVCNPSLLKFHNNRYIMTYRRLHYFMYPDVLDRCIHDMHPWKIWDNGHKLLYRTPDAIPPHAPKYGQRKYRGTLLPDTFIPITDNNPYFRIPVCDGEFDSTGMCFLDFDMSNNTFHVVSKNPNIFGKHMNQDTRITHVHPSYHDTHTSSTVIMTYNSFFYGGYTKMIYREMNSIEDDMCDQVDTFYCSDEKELVHPTHRQSIEKNCSLFRQQYVLYGFHYGTFLVHDIETGQHIQSPCPILEKTIQLLGRSNVFFSLGTPALSFRPGFGLACGHVKLKCYKDRLRCHESYSGLSPFFEHVDWSTIYRHGKYLYFMFFFEFHEKTFQITRVSPAFLPTNHGQCHLPFLLTFPTGLTFGRNQDELFLSYGEGDVRCKILGLNRDEMENMLFDVDTHDSMSFTFLNVDEWNQKRRVFHYGYFYEWNCGDDMFLKVWRYLHTRKHPGHFLPYIVKFRNDYDRREICPQRGDVAIFGGGDILTPYFLNSIENDNIKKHAIGVGLPYESFGHVCRLFDTLVLRNSRDVSMVHSITSRSSPPLSFPDLGFLLPCIWPISHTPPPPDSTVHHVGVTLCRTFYQPRNEYQHYYVDFVISFTKVLQLFLEKHPTVHLNFIPFCISDRKHYEDDRVIHLHVLQLLSTHFPHRISDFSQSITYDAHDYVYQTYREISRMDCMICSRFHAHIFAMTTHTPFLSITTSRKCQELMLEHHLEKYSICLDKDNNYKPLGIQNISLVFDRLTMVWERRLDIRQELQTLYRTSIFPQCELFLKFWTHFVHSYLHYPHTHQLPPSS